MKNQMDKCTVVDGCEAEATYAFVWAWGQKGASCDDHRAIVESQAAQLQRGISWQPIGEPKTDPGRRPYHTPGLVPIDPELGKLRLENAQLREQNARLQDKVAGLTNELEAATLHQPAPAETPAPAESVIEGSTTRTASTAKAKKG